VVRTDGSGNLDWYMTNAVTGTAPASSNSLGDYGVSTDVPVAGDWDYA
jgi:hypothetical protein